jgi:hypothetical protein
VSDFFIKIKSNPGPKFVGNTNYLKREKHENLCTNNNNCPGIAVYGDRPDNGGTTTDAGADERDADYCSRQGE